jgi:hypothetical protein
MEFESAANLVKISCGVDPMNMARVTMSPCCFTKMPVISMIYDFDSLTQKAAARAFGWPSHAHGMLQPA